MAWASWNWGKLNHRGWKEYNMKQKKENPKGWRLTISNEPSWTNSWSLMPFLESNSISIAYHKLHSTLLRFSPSRRMSSPQSSSPRWKIICHLVCYGNVMYCSQRGKAFQWAMSETGSPMIRSLRPSSQSGTWICQSKYSNPSSSISPLSLVNRSPEWPLICQAL